MSNKVYEMVTNAVIEKLEAGTVPWKKPFLDKPAVNWKTQTEYRGINKMLLDGGEYATFKQIQAANGKVKKGSKSSTVVFWKMIKIEDEETGEEKTVPMMRYYKVFKVGEQTEGIEPKRQDLEYQHDTIETAKEILNQYQDKPQMTDKDESGAYYTPALDRVNVPKKENFPKIEDYYNVLFHELVHSTGHKSRLNRNTVSGVTTFGSEKYSKEELIAEIGASMLSGIAGIENETLDNSASYINSWLQQLRNDKTLIISASQQAQKASDYIQGITHKEYTTS